MVYKILLILYLAKFMKNINTTSNGSNIYKCIKREAYKNTELFNFSERLF